MSEENNSLSIQQGPGSYTVVGKDIKNVQVQEADLNRLQDHLGNIGKLEMKFDLFTLFLGVSLSNLLSFGIEWYNTKAAPIIYLGIAFCNLVVSFICFACQRSRMDLQKAQHLLDEAKKDLKSIFDKANLRN